MKQIILILFMFVCISEALAGPGKIIINGPENQIYIYNNKLGGGRKLFTPEKGLKETIIFIPEEQCTDLLYMLSGDCSSWIQIKPDEEMRVDMTRQPWVFSGDEAAVNNYLYSWTREFYFKNPNMLIFDIEKMFNFLPDNRRTIPQTEQFYTPGYMAWMAELNDKLQKQLENANLPDSVFVAGQKQRIYYAWLEMQLLNYQYARGNCQIPSEAFAFAKDVTFDNKDILTLRSCDNILGIYFFMCDECGLLPCTTTNFLRVRAENIQSPEVREHYILNELNTIVNRGKWFYQAKEIFSSVAGMITSEAGKSRLQQLNADYNKLQENCKNGQPMYPFTLTDPEGKTHSLAEYKGKFLFIDLWASWCAPCKFQIPALQQLEKEMHGKNIRFLSISADKPQDREKWISTMKEYNMTGNHLISPNGFNYEMFKTYAINSIPRFMLVDPDGRIVMDNARRPSDPLLKLQLNELLEQYQNTFTLEGVLPEPDDTTISLIKRDLMSKSLNRTVIRDSIFTMQTVLESPGFITISIPRKLSLNIWVEPGTSMKMTQSNGNIVFEGSNSEINNLLSRLDQQYNDRFPPYSKHEIFDKKRSKTLLSIYRDMAKEVEKSSLSASEKALTTGYLQGELLNNLYQRIILSKIFGKSQPIPYIRNDYSNPVFSLKLVPEITFHNQWFNNVEEYLYAQIKAGKIKIRSMATRTVDMANGLSDPKLREAFIVKSLQTDLLRGFLVGIDDRISAARPMVIDPENQRELDRITSQIPTMKSSYRDALPGTDVSTYSFKNEKGETVSLGDFKGHYVFIDLWSTGCNPCVGEIPYIKDMEKQFAGQPIAWLSISLDLNEKTWKDFLVKHAMKGTQLLCEKGFKHPFIQQIGVKGIPHFILLDKKGKIIDYNTLRPSNPVLGETLKLLLSTKIE